DLKSLADGGLILQKSFTDRILKDSDFLPAIASKEGVEVQARRPSEEEFRDLRFAWAVESGVTSNSVIFVRDGVTCAIGTGEQDRVGCVELAIHKAYTKYADVLAFKEHGLSLYELQQKAAQNQEFKEKLAAIEVKTKEDHGGLTNSRMVSDGFFPFRDGVDVAIAQGVSAIGQPGGAIRDAEVIMACNEASPQVAMVFTAQRSFKH
ncbi:MAG: IMP cyclohydrolase, partial [Desulfovibrio sp.]|nr:IMP cyclohydrolase [Desulfovibrio sp.]